MKPFKFREPINLLFCTSTNDVVRDLSSLEEGIIVTSMIQTAGRGRNGKEWLSTPGGLYFSFLLKPQFDTCLNEKIALLTGRVLMDVLKSYIDPQKIQFKEPNDILIADRKLSGILIEAKIEENRNLYLVTGIGVNISNNVLPYATSLKNEGITNVDSKEFFEKFISYFEKTYNEWLNSFSSNSNYGNID
jgi:BirA family biotin operon repressor/biotin-[acetyl-CoA-carboxylase] ligase